MTATLRVRLLKYLGGRGTVDGLVANVYGLDEHGRRDHARDRRNLVIPAGPGTESLEIAVAPGDYVIEATLPSGDVTSDQVTVADGERREVTLQGPHSPNEWLSWQQFVGNVPALPDLPEKKPRRTRSATQLGRIEDFVREEDIARAGRLGLGRGARIGGGGCIRTGGPRGARPVTGRPGAGPSARVQVAEVQAARWPAVWFIRQPVAALAGQGPGGDAWGILGGEAEVRRPLDLLADGVAARADPQLEQSDFRLYDLGADGSLTPGGKRRPGGVQLPRRYVVSIQSRGPVEVACLPVPWDTAPCGPVPIELLVRHHPKPGEAVLALSPQDNTVRSALGYMGSGALSNARVMFETAQDLLFGKMVNALAAAAGGYVLLATEQGPDRQPWHQWIENLGRWFEWLPDGMIQYGRLRLLRRRGKADVDAARGAFFTAYDRGIPFYSLGLQWLVDGLSLLASGDDEEARDRLRAVQQVTWRANLQQPFTTLRLRDR